jgi:hypothetical protein
VSLIEPCGDLATDLRHGPECGRNPFAKGLMHTVYRLDDCQFLGVPVLQHKVSARRHVIRRRLKRRACQRSGLRAHSGGSEKEGRLRVLERPAEQRCGKQIRVALMSHWPTHQPNGEPIQLAKEIDAARARIS